MKKLFVLFILFSIFTFGQGWNSTVTTSINEPNMQKMDITANSFGIHVLIKRSNGNIVYYFLDSDGTVDANKTITLETNGDFPTIASSNTNVYAFWRVSGYIKGKYSTNGGASWISLSARSTSSNVCNGVDAIYQEQVGVHLVYALQDNGSDYETYYYRLNTFNQWVDYKQVTDYSNEIGGNPSVAVAPNRVIVSYNTNNYSLPGPGNVKTRDKIGVFWQTPLTAVSGSDQSSYERLLVRGDYVYLFYNQYVSGVPNRLDLDYRTRSITETTWSSPTELATSIGDFDSHTSVTKTSDDKIHLLCNTGIFNGQLYEGLVYTSFDGSIWSTPISLDNSYIFYPYGLSSVSNDLFITWRHDTNSYIRYKQYDAIPLPPPDIAVARSANDHPRLTWTKVEPDIDYYIVEKSYQGGWPTLDTTSNTCYEDVYEDYCPLGQLCIAGHNVNYRVKAVDYGDHTSDPSDVVTAYVLGNYPDKIIPQNNETIAPVEYKLEQNYPNPFNPTTSIYYRLKKAGYVTLKIYNMLGQEIAGLVKENQSEGYHSVEFNASDIPSGIYFYQIKSGEFSDIKKMMLVK